MVFLLFLNIIAVSKTIYIVEDRDNVLSSSTITFQVWIFFLMLLRCLLWKIVLGGPEFLFGGVRVEIVIKLSFLLASYLLLLLRRFGVVAVWSGRG